MLHIETDKHHITLLPVAGESVAALKYRAMCALGLNLFEADDYLLWQGASGPLDRDAPVSAGTAEPRLPYQLIRRHCLRVSVMQADAPSPITHCLDVSQTCSVRELKELLSTCTGIPVSEQGLMIESAPMDSAKLLVEYLNVLDGAASCVLILVRMKCLRLAFRSKATKALVAKISVPPSSTVADVQAELRRVYPPSATQVIIYGGEELLPHRSLESYAITMQHTELQLEDSPRLTELILRLSPHKEIVLYRDQSSHEADSPATAFPETMGELRELVRTCFSAPKLLLAVDTQSGELSLLADPDHAALLSTREGKGCLTVITANIPARLGDDEEGAVECQCWRSITSLASSITGTSPDENLLLAMGIVAVCAAFIFMRALL